MWKTIIGSSAVKAVNDTISLRLKRSNMTRWNSTIMTMERLVMLIDRNGGEALHDGLYKA